MDYRSILQVAEKNKIRALKKIRRLSASDNDNLESTNSPTIPSSAVQRQLKRQNQAKQMEKKRLGAEEAKRLEQIKEIRVREEKTRPKRGAGIYRDYERLKMQREHDTLKASEKMNEPKKKESSEEEKMHTKFMQFVDAKNCSSLNKSSSSKNHYSTATLHKDDVNAMKTASSFEKAMAIANRNAALAEASLKKAPTQTATFFESLISAEKAKDVEKRPAAVDPNVIKKFMKKFNESQLNKYKARVPTLGEVVGKSAKVAGGGAIDEVKEEAPPTSVDTNDVKAIFDKFQTGREKSSLSKNTMAAEKRAHSTTSKDEPAAKKVQPLSYMETLALAQKNMNRDNLLQKIKEERGTTPSSQGNKATPGVVLTDSTRHYDHGEVLRKRRLEREREALQRRTPAQQMKKQDKNSKASSSVAAVAAVAAVIPLAKSKTDSCKRQVPADAAAPNATVLQRLAQLEAEAAALRASLCAPVPGGTGAAAGGSKDKPTKAMIDRETVSSQMKPRAKSNAEDMSVSLTSVPGSLRQVVTGKRAPSPPHHKKEMKKRSFAPRPYMPEDWEISEEEEEEDEDLDGFIDDSEDAFNNYGKCIREIHKSLKFDPRKYASVKPWDDCRDMEVNRFGDIEKEDRRSSRLGALEDMAEERNQMLKMARRMAKVKKGRRVV